MNYEQIVAKIAEDKRKALENPYITLANVRDDMAENFSLREATKANNEAHGYTASYNEDGYVQHGDRNSNWQAVANLIEETWEARNERVEHNSWVLGLVIHTLTYKQLKAIADIISGTESA